MCCRSINFVPQDNTTRDWTYDLSSKNGSYKIVARSCEKNPPNEIVEQEMTVRWGPETGGNSLTLAFELASKSNTLKLRKVIFLVNTTSLPDSKGEQISMFYEREAPALGKGFSYSCFPNEESLALTSETGSKTAVGHVTIASGKVEAFREANDTMLSTEISCHVANAPCKNIRYKNQKFFLFDILFWRDEWYVVFELASIELAAESSEAPFANEPHGLETSQTKHHEEPSSNDSATGKQMCKNFLRKNYSIRIFIYFCDNFFSSGCNYNFARNYYD